MEWLLRSAHTVAGVLTQPDKPVGRHQVLQASAIKQIALREGLPVLQPQKLREPAEVRALGEWEPELLVVMAYGQILPLSVLELPTLACLNLHASLLPRHRGAAPIQAAIEAGDKESGVTVMYMAEGLDTGDILLEQRVRLRRRETEAASMTGLDCSLPRLCRRPWNCLLKATPRGCLRTMREPPTHPN